MTREVKFRAWNTVYNTMEQWNHVKGWEALGQLFVSDEYVFEQFTGLKDKNGKEIFEGDILGGYPHGTACVFWNNEYACFESGSVDKNTNEDEVFFSGATALLANDLKYCFDGWEVIGNIHENPELLKL